jgi:hypothetical protein
VPWYDGTGNLTALNTTSCEIGVGPEKLISAASREYAGFRMISISNGELVSWGLAGADNDPLTKWSIPGWQGLGVGTATAANPTPNGYEIYRTNRPSIQWMEQDQAAQTTGGSRAPIVNGEGTFTTPSLGGAIALPLNDRGIGGPFPDVTCKVKNTLDGSTGAALTLTGCRIEFPMRKLRSGWHYAVENGTILEQYNTDSGERMVVVLVDVAPGVVPVHVYATAN